MKKFSLYYWMIFLVYFFVMTHVNAAPMIAPPDTPTTNKSMIVDPSMFPELKQETDLIDYIVGHVDAYVKSHEWDVLLNEEESQLRVDELDELLTEYGYGHDFHYIELQEVLHRETLELAWYDLTVIIFYKADPKISSVNKWKIIYVEVPKKEGA